MPGRNDPCPCGSGKKYKQCHLRDENAQSAQMAIAQRIHDRDRLLSGRMMAFADARFGPDWPQMDVVDETEMQFAIPFVLHHERHGGKTIADLFAAASPIDADTRRWLAAQSQAWVSIWEVQSVDAGRQIELRDRLTGAGRVVIEHLASESLVAGDHILARIADFDAASYLCGMFPISLGPLDAQRTLEEARAGLHVKRSVTAKRLRSPLAARIVAETFIGTADRVMEAARRGPELRNGDGDPVVMVKDRFVVTESDAADVRRAIGAMPGAEEFEDDEVAILRGKTVVAGIRFVPNGMECESISVSRADSARSMIETATAGKARFRVREIVDPMSEAARAAVSKAPPPDRSQDIIDFETEWKRDYYTKWMDEPVPFLNGLTPRESTETRDGRERVESLLRHFERIEARSEAEPKFDFAWLRRELGLD